MSNLPVIIGFGGVNPAGRGSFHNSYQRMVLSALDKKQSEKTLRGLATLMGIEIGNEGIETEQRRRIEEGTLVRKIEAQCFPLDEVLCHRRIKVNAAEPLRFTIPASQMPRKLPDGWTIHSKSPTICEVEISSGSEWLVADSEEMKISGAGQLPSGFEPGALYASRSHPRGLQMAIYAASDALRSTGLDWHEIRKKLAPEQISVYAGSLLGQLDQHGFGGMLNASLLDKRMSARYCPFGFAEMTADFVSAYVLGSCGAISASLGACASFLHNLKQGIQDIREGRARFAMIGASEAPVIPEVLNGFAAMKALATDQQLAKLDGISKPDLRRSCRPFGDNCGFTMGEAGHFFVLTDDQLALELGATIHGACTDVFINADGYKRSISSPGVGNLLTLHRAAGSVCALLGEEALRRRSVVHAHGTGTPQNRITESEALSQTATRFGIEKWPVSAIKCFLGHSLAAASADQLIAALGAWAHGIMPGITTIDRIADDVHSEGLALSPEHRELSPEQNDIALINAKGFGGNNATAVGLGPKLTMRLLTNKHGRNALTEHQRRNEAIKARAQDYEEETERALPSSIYHFNEAILENQHVEIKDKSLFVPGFGEGMRLDQNSPYAEYADT